jgi:hypothetical protein
LPVLGEDGRLRSWDKQSEDQQKVEDKAAAANETL